MSIDSNKEPYKDAFNTQYRLWVYGKMSLFREFNSVAVSDFITGNTTDTQLPISIKLGFRRYLGLL